jgi:hypothetical protein
MANTKYVNTDLGIVPSGGGSVRVTLASSVGQGNGGTSLPCKKATMNTDGTDVRVTVGAACTAITGIQVPQAEQVTNKVCGYLTVEIDDVSKLYFYGTTGKVIDILYLK